MSHSNALATTQQQALTSPDAWKVMREQADMLVKSGLLPDGINKPEAAIAIMMTGAEFGFTPMQSFRLINVIKGKPTLTADGMAALVMQYCERRGDGYLKVIESDNDHCTVEYRRPGEQDAHRVTFTIEDAKRAGLLGNPMWSKYPKNMCMARTKANACREGFPDVVGGVYDPDELPMQAAAIEATGYVASPPPTLIANTSPKPTPISDADRRAGRKTETPEWAKEVADNPYRLNAMRRLHAIGDTHGIDHDMLHAYALINGKSGVSQYSNEELIALSNEIDTSEIAPLMEMFGPIGWTPPQWMVHHAVVDTLQPKTEVIDTETGEIIDVTSDPLAEEEARAKAKRTLWNAVKAIGWTVADLEALATYTDGKTLGDMTREEYEAVHAWFLSASDDERAEELAAARQAVGKVA